MFTARTRITVATLAACLLSACEKNVPVTEDKAVLDSYEVALFVPDPDLSALFVHAAWLGPDAIGPALKTLPSAGANDMKRVKVAKLLEVMAWNGIRDENSVKALASLLKDKQPQVRMSAIYGLFASAADLTKLDGYWDPSGPDPSKNVNPSVTAALPFGTCRQLLADRKVIAAGPDGKVAGDAGRPHAAMPAVPAAGRALTKAWTAETDINLKFFAAIQALRMGAQDAVDALIGAMMPPPKGVKPAPAWELNRARALRALQEATGQNLTTYDEWQAWRAKTRPQPKPPQVRPPKLEPK